MGGKELRFEPLNYPVPLRREWHRRLVSNAKFTKVSLGPLTDILPSTIRHQTRDLHSRLPLSSHSECLEHLERN